MSGVRLGVAYYPEQWPRERWPIDAALMSEAGLKIARVGEFAWAHIEPAAGRFELDWLDEAIGLLAAAGLEVVLGTPTAAPPAWLIEEHPEILPVADDGPVDFGHRRHYCPNQPSFHEATERVVRALAERFGPDERVIGWQIDNEFGGRCRCDRCRVAFQEWLRDRYGSLERLNETWGTAFWSQTYSDWSQIRLPDRPPRVPNPGLALDYRRFVSDSFARYQALQASILRELRGSHQFVTHNLMGFGFPELDYHRLAEDLDVVSWDNYPILDPAGRWTSPALSADAMRGLKRRNVWVMEQQVGPLGWEWLKTPHRQQGRVWVYQAIAHGAEAVVFFRWRTARFGTEQHWHGILEADGSIGHRYAELCELAIELAELGGRLTAVAPESQVAILHDYDSRFAAQVQPTNEVLGYEESVHSHYAALRQLGLGVDLLASTADLRGYAIVVAPNLRVVDADTAAALTAYVRDGGRLVLAPRAAVRNRSGAVPDRPLPAWLDELVGARVRDYISGSAEQAVRFGGSDGARPPGEYHGWFEELDVADAEVAAVYLDGPFAGTPALTDRREGHGVATYLAGVADLRTLRALYARLAVETGLAPVELPDGVELVRARNAADDQLVFLLNHSAEERAVVLAEADGTVTLPAYGVSVLSPERKAAPKLAAGEGRA